MIMLEDARREFWDAWNGLSEVHIQEDLDAQSKKMWEARERLLKVDPEFRAMIKAREDKINTDADARRVQIETKHKSIMSKAEEESQSIISAANAKAKAMQMSDADLDGWVQKHKFKIVTPEEAKVKSKLVCPICYSPDRGNIINEKPACFSCMHELVLESELKNYNRTYRRKWKRNRK